MQATRKLGLEYSESVLYRAALEAGFGYGSEQRARDAQQAFLRGGFTALPAWCRSFIEKVNTKGA